MSNNAVLAKYAAINKRIQNVEPDTGQGSLGWWPPEGKHVVGLKSLKIEEGKFIYFGKKGEKGSRKELPALVVETTLQLTQDPESPTPRSFRGRRFVIPADDSTLPDNQKTRVEIEDRRLKGLLTIALGVSEVPDTIAALMGLEQLVAEKAKANTMLFLTVDCAYDDSTKAKNADGTAKRVPDKEYYVERRGS